MKTQARGTRAAALSGGIIMNGYPNGYSNGYPNGNNSYPNGNNSYPNGNNNSGGNSAKKSGGAGRIIFFIALTLVILALIIGAVAVGCMYLFKSAMTAYWNYMERNGSETAAEAGQQQTDQSPAQTVDIGAVVLPEVNLSAAHSSSEMSIAETVKIVKNSVVEITTEIKSSGGFSRQYVISGAGSGVIISETGLVITNNHVIDGASRITVRLTNGNEFEAMLIGTDEENDIAVLSFAPGGEKLTAAKNGNSDILETGQQIIVIGNPLGELGGTVTSGIISCTAREIQVEDVGTMTLLQTDAAVNPGNSGGGMFNLYGELIGIVNAKSSGTSVEGLGFAIPVNTAWKIASELINYGYVRGRASLDLSYVDFSSFEAMYYFKRSNMPAGVYIFESNEKLGVSFGDRIISINETEITSSADISAFLKKCSVGDTVKLTVMRSGKTVTVSIKLVEKKPAASN